ncbi:glycosyltransferase [Roseiconus lacunae]|uniref:glycosyltransferase n=1 Tax=Roseiconus lacunae TaxID=2605694 RepID=UPI00308A6F87|nr:glycosyltransferase [Stieleria sp. HD01]
MLPEHQVTWVNTIGMRPPRLDMITIRRGLEKLRGWKREVASGERLEASDEKVENDQVLEPASSATSENSPLATSNLQLPSHRSPPAQPAVIDAKMWPWMSHRWDRWLNRRLLTKQLREAAEDAVVITTIPIVADLVDSLPAKRWVYYCVDDFSVWPGLDGEMLGRMEDELVAKVDCTIAVSDTLMDSLRRRGCSPHLLTHGVDLDFWRTGQSRELLDASGKEKEKDQEREPAASDHSPLASRNSPLILFWGVLDRRMNADWVLGLADSLDGGEVRLVGPHQDPDPRLLHHDRIRTPGAVPFDELPRLASTADVLIMPYADLPVTRAMQPLKLKEYLATGKPVVVSPLPATTEWRDCLHVVDDQASFIARVKTILNSTDRTDGEAARTQVALTRLDQESWSAKAATMLGWIG